MLEVSLPRPAGVLARRALALQVSCKRGCRILVTASLSGARQSATPLPLLAVARGLPAAVAGHVRLRIGPRSLQRLRSQLGARRQMTARITIVAAGPTGLRTTFTRGYTVSR